MLKIYYSLKKSIGLNAILCIISNVVLTLIMTLSGLVIFYILIYYNNFQVQYKILCSYYTKWQTFTYTQSANPICISKLGNFNLVI